MVGVMVTFEFGPRIGPPHGAAITKRNLEEVEAVIDTFHRRMTA
jgi:hypothetical protein